MEKSKNAELKEALKNLKEGDIVENAKVKATTDWGIFLDIDGIDALLHVMICPTVELKNLLTWLQLVKILK